MYLFHAIGDIVALALVVAISPFTVIPVVLMLLSPRAKAVGGSFAIGWLVGITLVASAAVALAQFIPEPGPSESQPITAVILIVLGIALIGLAVRSWRNRKAEDTEASMPSWMSKMDTMGPPAAAGFGFLLAAVKPKNLIIGVSAGLAIASAELALGQNVIVITVYVILASLSVLGLVIAYFISPTGMLKPLEALRDWLVAYNSVIMGSLMLLIGFVLIGEGIGHF